MTTDTQGGADWELGQAAERLSTILGVEGERAEALRLALSDHAAAVGSKSTAMIAALFTPLLSGQQQMQASIAGLRDEGEKRQTYLLKQMSLLIGDVDARLDHYGQEIDGIRSDQRATLAAVEGVAASVGGLEARVERVEIGQAKLEIRVEAVETQGAPAQAVDLLFAVETRLDELERLLVLTRRQLWLTFAAVASIAMIFVIAILVNGGGR